MAWYDEGSPDMLAARNSAWQGYGGIGTPMPKSLVDYANNLYGYGTGEKAPSNLLTDQQGVDWYQSHGYDGVADPIGYGESGWALNPDNWKYHNGNGTTQWQSQGTSAWASPDGRYTFKPIGGGAYQLDDLTRGPGEKSYAWYNPDGTFNKDFTGAKNMTNWQGVLSVVGAAFGMGAIGAAAGGAGAAGAAGAGAGEAGAAGAGAGAGVTGFGDAGMMYGGADAAAAGSLGGGASVAGGSALGDIGAAGAAGAAGGGGGAGAGVSTGSASSGDIGTMYGGANAGDASSLGGGASVNGGAALGSGSNLQQIISQINSSSSLTNAAKSALVSILGGGGGGGAGGAGTSTGGLGLGDIAGLAGGGLDAYQQGQAAAKMKAWLDSQNTAMNGYMNPGSPEYNQMWEQMSRNDAAAGRNSQYGPRTSDFLAKIAQAKAQNTLNFTTGNSRAYAAALNQDASKYAGLSAALQHALGGTSGGSTAGLASIIRALSGNGTGGSVTMPTTSGYSDSVGNMYGGVNASDASSLGGGASADDQAWNDFVNNWINGDNYG